jgi:hypothetical protein
MIALNKMSNDSPPLRSLHPEVTLIPGKLAVFEHLTTETITASLLPGKENCLKTRTDGTILEGNHRIHVLRKRGVDVDRLPREIVARTQL